MRLPGLALACLLVTAGCSSSLNSNAGTSPVTAGGSTTSTSNTTAATTGGPTTTAPVVVETAATTVPSPTTVAPTTKPTAAPTTTVSGPHFVKTPTFKLSAACTAGTTSVDLVITWDAAGADSVYDAVADPNGPYNQDLPLKGSDTLNYNCGQPQTYYVVAVKGSQKKVVSKTISA